MDSHFLRFEGHRNEASVTVRMESHLKPVAGWITDADMRCSGPV
jgi:hypothetical protein